MPTMHGFLPTPAAPLPPGILTTTQLAGLRAQLTADLARDLDDLRRHATQLPSADRNRRTLTLRRRIDATRANLDELGGV